MLMQTSERVVDVTFKILCIFVVLLTSLIAFRLWDFNSAKMSLTILRKVKFLKLIPMVWTDDKIFR